MSASALPIMSTTGSSTVASVITNVGRATVRRSVVVAVPPEPLGVVTVVGGCRRGTSTQRAA